MSTVLVRIDYIPIGGIPTGHSMPYRAVARVAPDNVSRRAKHLLRYVCKEIVDVTIEALSSEDREDYMIVYGPHPIDADASAEA